MELSRNFKNLAIKSLVISILNITIKSTIKVAKVATITRKKILRSLRQNQLLHLLQHRRQDQLLHLLNNNEEHPNNIYSGFKATQPTTPQYLLLLLRHQQLPLHNRLINIQMAMARALTLLKELFSLGISGIQMVMALMTDTSRDRATLTHDLLVTN